MRAAGIIFRAKPKFECEKRTSSYTGYWKRGRSAEATRLVAPQDRTRGDRSGGNASEWWVLLHDALCVRGGRRHGLFCAAEVFARAGRRFMGVDGGTLRIGRGRCVHPLVEGARRHRRRRGRTLCFESERVDFRLLAPVAAQALASRTRRPPLQRRGGRLLRRTVRHGLRTGRRFKGGSGHVSRAKQVLRMLRRSEFDCGNRICFFVAGRRLTTIHRRHTSVVCPDRRPDEGGLMF